MFIVFTELDFWLRLTPCALILIVLVPLPVFITESLPFTEILLLPFPTVIVAETLDVIILLSVEAFISTLSPEFITILSLPFPVLIFIAPLPLIIKLSLWLLFALRVKLPPSIVKVLFVAS